jgi:ribosomal protein S27E
MLKIKKDKYLKSRGGSISLLLISCSNCNKYSFVYQKDGPGKIIRFYQDRILLPKELVGEISSYKTKSEMKALKCPECNSIMAIPMIYKKENRLAYKVIRGRVKKSNYI